MGTVADDDGQVVRRRGGCGCLALLVFVVPELVSRPAPTMSSDEIVAEVLAPEEPVARESGGLVDAVIPVPLPPRGCEKTGKKWRSFFLRRNRQRRMVTRKWTL